MSDGAIKSSAASIPYDLSGPPVTLRGLRVPREGWDKQGAAALDKTLRALHSEAISELQHYADRWRDGIQATRTQHERLRQLNPKLQVAFTTTFLDEQERNLARIPGIIAQSTQGPDFGAMLAGIENAILMVSQRARIFERHAKSVAALADQAERAVPKS